MKLPFLVSALSIFAMSTGVLLATDILFIDESFDVSKPDAPETPSGYENGESGVTATRAFKEGAGVEGSRAMVLSAEFGESSPEGAAVLQYQNGDVTGNHSVEPSEYFLEFSAKGSKASKDFHLIIQGWSNPGFQGGEQGSIDTTLTLPDTPDTFKTYRITLDDASFNGNLDPSSKTYQIMFGIISGNWGGDGVNELVIDNIKLGHKTNP